MVRGEEVKPCDTQVVLLKWLLGFLTVELVKCLL